MFELQQWQPRAASCGQLALCVERLVRLWFVAQVFVELSLVVVLFPLTVKPFEGKITF